MDGPDPYGCAPEAPVKSQERPRPHRVLIVDQDEAPTRGLQNQLISAGFIVTVHCGAQPFMAVERDCPDLIVLNWNLPDMAVRDLLQQLRHSRPADRPNLLAVGEGCGEHQILAGFELGVDDFMVKPFSEPQLVARVRAILRSRLHRPAEKNRLRFGELEMIPGADFVYACGQSVPLRVLEARLLRFLLENPNRVFNRQQLMSRVWGPASASDARAVDATIQRMRKALATRSCGDYLQAVRGVGYRLSSPASSPADSEPVQPD